MDTTNTGAILRFCAAVLLAAAIWALAKYETAEPKVLGLDAPVTAFSSGRAFDTLGRILGPEKPHPAGSAENAASRARIVAEFARLGVKTETYTAFSCNAWRGFRVVPCATVTDILAEVVPGEGKAIVLLAHYDSVPAGPGASDDGSGVATVLETARALRARGGKSAHPVLAVITDGEEFGLLGAQAFLNNPTLAARVGVVINVEARGTRGRSLMFQTSPGDGRLIDLYAKSVSFYGTSSLYAEIYKFLPNDTDLTLFIKAGFPSYNFAFVENVADYHTSLDRKINLSRLTLQEHGENMLGLASALEQTNYADLKGSNDIYLDIFGAVLPRLPASWALPLALLTLLVLVGGIFLSRGEPTRKRDWLFAFLMPLALLAGCVLTGLALHFIAQIVSHQPDPSFAHPAFLRAAMALGVVATTLLVARMAPPRLAAIAVWVWFAALSVVMAALLPGVSPFFLFPALAAAILALVTIPFRVPAVGQTALLLAALVGLSIWMGFAASGELLLGLRMHPLFTVPAAFGAMTLIPLLHTRAIKRTAWLSMVGVGFAAAIVLSVVAGLQPAFSRVAAQRLSLSYVESDGQAQWVVDAGAPLPGKLRAAAGFSTTPQMSVPGQFFPAYAASAGAAQFPPPKGEAVASGHRIEISLHGSPQATGMLLIVPKAAGLKAIDIGGQHLVAPVDLATDTVLACLTPDCAQEHVSLDVATNAPFEIQFAEQRHGLPPQGGKLLAARPKTAVPSQNGDITVLFSKLTVPAGR
jgi:hypothetical protein